MEGLGGSRWQFVLLWRRPKVFKVASSSSSSSAPKRQSFGRVMLLAEGFAIAERHIVPREFSGGGFVTTVATRPQSLGPSLSPVHVASLMNNATVFFPVSFVVRKRAPTLNGGEKFERTLKICPWRAVFTSFCRRATRDVALMSRFVCVRWPPKLLAPASVLTGRQKLGRNVEIVALYSCLGERLIPRRESRLLRGGGVLEGLLFACWRRVDDDDARRRSIPFGIDCCCCSLVDVLEWYSRHFGGPRRTGLIYL